LWLLRSNAALSGVGRRHHLLLNLSLILSVAVVSNHLGNYVPPAAFGVRIQPSTGT
jgi:hypothetical protein